MTRWQWILRQFTRKLWVRISLFCLAAILSALLAYLMRGVIPEDVPRKVGADAVDSILQIIASSMLAVTTFSLSTMVAAYTAATSNATPRATRLMLEDQTTQNALATFIGSFLFSLIGIVALTMEVYGERGRLILFLFTIAVIVIIIVVLIRWINYLSRLGRVEKTIDLVEAALEGAIRSRLERPYLGAVPLLDQRECDGLVALRNDYIGYVQNIDVQALNAIAEKNDLHVYVQTLPGALNDGLRPILMLSSEVEDEVANRLLEAVTIAPDRSFDQDPRFGLIVLGEIASRALSPGINDPGTAIEIISTLVRVLAPWMKAVPLEPEVIHERVHVPPVTTEEFFEDAFRPIARDGAGMVEVGIRLQKALGSLAAMGGEEVSRVALLHSREALERAGHALGLAEDLARLRVEAERLRLADRGARKGG